MDAYSQTIESVVDAQNSDVERGLSATDARSRLSQLGRNELNAAKAIPEWKKFLSQFSDVLVILLLIAAGVSAALWIYERDSALPYESIVILAVVILNALIGYVQGHRAETALAALSRMAAAHARVIRDGEPQSILATELVPGDLILLEEGDTVPADARVVRSTSLQLAEASLTGESNPVSKGTQAIDRGASLGDRLNMVFSGTTVTYGRGSGIVVATGMKTEIGRIAGWLAEAPSEETPLQRELDRLGKVLGAIVVVIAIVMILTILVSENVQDFSTLFDVLILGVALAVAAVPEGLPALVTTVLALGVQRMAKRKAIVRHLAAVETLGSANVIASDKTGTLTKNEMTVRSVITASGRVEFDGIGYAPHGSMQVIGGGALEASHRAELERALTVADRATNAVLKHCDGYWTVHGDPTEGALLAAARKAGIQSDLLNARFDRVGEVPFSSERKLMTTIQTDAERDERLYAFTKGAPGVLLERCTQERVGNEKRWLTAARRAEILKLNEGLAGDALRTLGIAARELPPNAMLEEVSCEILEKDLVFLGLVGMMDPPRDEAKQAVAIAKSAGVRPIMITGDHPKTASVIAVELGVSSDGRVVIGSELEKMSQEQLVSAVASVSVFARVSPEQKLRIVKALQRSGAIVAMTGDGVNDAPALKTADIGVAMGITGTDVSKEASDIVLADDNYATIVAAIQEGRAIYDNIRKFLRYLLSSNIGEVMTMFLGVLFAKVIGLHEATNALVLPLLATQILWINLVTDGAPALALGVDPPADDLMHRSPRPRHEAVITRHMWCGIVFVGAIMAIGTLSVLDACMPGGLIEGHGTLRYAQTMAFTTLVLFQLFNVFNSRSDDQSALVGFFKNGWLWGALAISLLLQVSVVYVPMLQDAFSTESLSVYDWSFCLAVASSVLWIRELNKLWTRWFYGAIES